MNLQPKIHVLPDLVADMIAAGEVVDRPASVVKELAENSIDAGAANVSVSIAGGGKTTIIVEDDGCGMASEDALLSFKRHATSKITLAEDLLDIATHGFRGEALPSIASVSRVRLVTKTSFDDTATLVVVEGGRISPPVEVSGAPGTRIEVNDLFFNTPARRKFLKSDATETKNVVDAITRLALLHPATGFLLTSDGRRLFSYPSGQTLRQRAADIVGPSQKLHWHESRSSLGTLVFACASPHEGKGRRDAMKFFVNLRAVNDRILAAALLEGYRGLLMEGRYPVALLWLTVDPALVDVNVHPAKREVRFAEESSIFRWVAGEVSRALAEAPWLSGSAAPSAAPALGGYGAVEDPKARVAEAIAVYGSRAGNSQRGSFGPPVGFGGYGRNTSSRPQPGLTGLDGVSPAFPGANPSPSGVFGSLRYMGAVDATYLLFEDRETSELVIIDQHAAHERILYEKLLNAAESKSVSQQLLIPVVIECGPGTMEILPERKEILASLGFLVEPFGQNALSIVSAPAGVEQRLLSPMVEDVLGAPIPEESDSRRVALEKYAARAACAAAVKAGKVLHDTEVEALLVLLGKARNPTNCPHGRPLLVRLGRAKLEALFMRR